jgi:hypothetical protein
MKIHRALCFLVLASATGLPQVQPPPPLVDGYVTRTAARDNFDVNGFRIVCGSQTMVGDPETSFTMGCPEQTPWVGEAMRVFGRRLKGRDAVSAERIAIVPEALPREITGSAVIDRVLSASRNPADGAVMVRADGYRLLIPASAALAFDPPLQGMANIGANLWIQYKAAPRTDGVLVVQAALVSPVAVRRSEDRMRAKTDYDPAAVPSGSKSPWYAPLDFKKLPPWPDAVMQKRVSDVGASIVPAYQKALPDTDPAKLHFRFEAVSSKRLGLQPVALPSGVVLIPYQDVERVKNDAQLAALLADAVASILERQTWRARNAVFATGATEAVAYATEAAAPVVSVASFIGSGAAASVITRKEEDQSGRVALTLLNDAGYDVEQAPTAWLVIASPKAKTTTLTMPERSAHLYRVLGAVWNHPPAVLPDTNPAAAQ